LRHQKPTTNKKQINFGVCGNIGGGDEVKDEGEAGSYGGPVPGASKKEKRLFLDQFMSTTGYGCSYARFVLRQEGRRESDL
jgi:hypothetical protein